VDKNTIEMTEKCISKFIDLLLKSVLHWKNIHSKLQKRMPVQLKWKTFQRVCILLFITIRTTTHCPSMVQFTASKGNIIS